MPKLLKVFTKHRSAWLIAIVVFFLRAGQFMTMPFFAIYLTKAHVLTASQIGVVLGIAALMMSGTGFINGLFIDKNCFKKVLYWGLLLTAICYVSFIFFVNYFLSLMILNACMGWLRSLMEISAMSILVSDVSAKELSLAYSMRFIGANLGVAIGPVIGAAMAMHNALNIFIVAGLINAFLAAIIYFYQVPPRSVNQAEPLKALANLKKILKDKMLLNMTFINFLLWTAYSQMDTTFPQYLTKYFEHSAIFFSQLMIVNAGICVLFQTAILRWAQRHSLKVFGMIGSAMFASAFILLAFNANHLGFFISIMIMSFAELFTLPINGLMVMTQAPKESIASYGGILNLGLLGLFIGPTLGGLGLDFLGGTRLFLLMSILPVYAILRYR